MGEGVLGKSRCSYKSQLVFPVFLASPMARVQDMAGDVQREDSSEAALKKVEPFMAMEEAD